MKLRKVVLEGCNGEWAQKHYLPVLAGRAAKGDIELWAVDIEDKIKLDSPQLEKDWQDAQSQSKAFYLNKNKDMQSYKELSNADFVFIVAPDRFHSEIATFWLERLSSGGKIFIEKPLDASLEAALRLKDKKIEEKGVKESVFGFDHYLARIYPLLSHLEKIGEVKKIRFHLLEASEISQQREKTLDTGVIFDLFCHVLALVYAVVSKDLICSATKLPVVELEKVKASRYAGCPISAETFASLKFTVNNYIEVDSAIGKCVGTTDDKSLSLWGANGKTKLNFVRNTFLVSDSDGRRVQNGKLASEPVKDFLGETLEGKKHPLSVPGVLSFDAALEILKILDKAKTQIGKIPEYQCHDSIDTILGILGERKVQ